LYAVETVRMLLDRGALVQDGAVYRPTATIEALEVPETLHALVAARLDGLSPSERRVLQDGSELGKTFTTQAVAVLSGLSGAELEPILVSLTRKEVLGVQADPRSPEHGQYGFLQDMLRRVAYETLAKTDRKARHLAAAAYLEESWGEHEVVEVVAAHYLDAYELAPEAPDAVEIRARAGERLARAGERAASLGASEEGERYYAQAAELSDDAVRRAELVEQGGRMAWLGARAERARVLLDEAHAVFEAEGLKKQAARVSAVLADIDFREGHPPKAVERLEAALEELSDEDPDEDVATVAAQLGRFLVLSRQYDLAAPRLELALELAEALRLPEVLSQALTSKSVLYTYRNRLEEARILLQGALERALAHDLHAAALRAYNNLAVTLESSDRYVEAVETSGQALELARKVGDRVWEVNFIGGPISGLVLLGRWDEAIARAGQYEENGGSQGFALPVVEAHCQRGNIEGARSLLKLNAHLSESEDMQASMGYLLAEAQVLRAEGKLAEALQAASGASASRDLLGSTFLFAKLGLVEALEAAFALGDTEKVRELIDDVDSLRPGERPPLLEAHAHRFRAKLAGDEASFTAGAALFRERGMVFWLAVTLLEHGESLVEQDRADEAGPLLAEAREIFERLKATPSLERVTAAAAEQEVHVPA
jgi:tetratricopeptide (TPR) repeat protein